MVQCGFRGGPAIKGSSWIVLGLVFKAKDLGFQIRSGSWLEPELEQTEVGAAYAVLCLCGVGEGDAQATCRERRRIADPPHVLVKSKEWEDEHFICT